MMALAIFLSLPFFYCLISQRLEQTIFTGPSFLPSPFFTGSPVPGRDILDITWHGVRLNEPAWHDGSTQFHAYTIAGLTSNEEDLHVILNMADLSIEAPLPPVPRRQWYLAVDTFEHATSGIFWPENQRPALSATWRVQPRSVLIFESRVGAGASI